MGAALILCRVARACARRSMPPDMTSAEFCSAHGDTFVAWLRDNTQECKCDEKYGNDEARQRGDVINADNEILCRRCFVCRSDRVHRVVCPHTFDNFHQCGILIGALGHCGHVE